MDYVHNVGDVTSLAHAPTFTESVTMSATAAAAGLLSLFVHVQLMDKKYLCTFYKPSNFRTHVIDVLWNQEVNSDTGCTLDDTRAAVIRWLARYTWPDDDVLMPWIEHVVDVVNECKDQRKPMPSWWTDV